MNALDNVSVMFPALLLSPVTLLFGPIAAFNVAGTLAPVINGYCMFLLARKLTNHVSGQIVAALIWGFSPDVLSNLLWGHAPDVFGFFLPLAGILVYDLVVDHKRRPSVDGMLFGALVVAQFFTSIEVLAICALSALPGIVFAAVSARRVLWANRRRLGGVAGGTVAVAGLALAYPAWFALAGPRHIVGPAWPITIVAPTWDYLGSGIVIFIGVSIPFWYKRRLAWFAAVTGIWASALSWGAPLGNDWWHPWKFFKNLPIISGIQVFRFENVVAFCAAGLMAMSIEGWWEFSVKRNRAQADTKDQQSVRSIRPAVSGTIGIAATIAGFSALVPIALEYSPTLPLGVIQTPTPAWFTHEALRLREGTRVLTIPFAANQPLQAGMIGTESMAYQAEDSIRFDLAGGYMVVPGAGGVSAWTLPLNGTSAILSELARPTPAQMAVATSETAGVRKVLRRWGVQVTVVSQPALFPDAVHYLTAVYGRAPLEQSGAAVWYGSVQASRRPQS